MISVISDRLVGIRAAVGGASVVWAALLATSGAKPVSPEEAAGKEGEVCEMMGQVLTQTRSGGNGYLNFGDVFPRQKFTVKYQGVDMESPFRGELMGREVLVKGEVVTESKNGPRIVVKERSEIEVLPIKENEVFSKPIDGAVDRKLYAVAWHQTLKREEFGKIEAKALEFAKGEQVTREGRLESISFFEGLAHGDPADENGLKKAGESVEKWRKEEPKSATAMQVQAGFLLERAWKRGGKVGEKRAKELAGSDLRDLEEAAKILEAVPSEERRPFYYQTALTLGIARHWSRDKMAEVFEESKRRYPSCFESYSVMAAYLLPQWYGGEGDWERWLGEETRKNDEVDRELYARVAWAQGDYYELSGENGFFRNTRVLWPKMKEGFHAMLRRCPESNWNVNSFARLASEAGDQECSKALLGEIEGREDMSVWVTWNSLNRAVSWANDQLGSEPPATGDDGSPH